MQAFVIIVLFLVVFIGLIVISIKSTKKKLIPKEIENGISATAIILDFHKAGGKYSQPSGGLDYVFKMFVGLKITDKNENSWEASTTEFVLESQFSSYRIGDLIHVKYNAIDTSIVVIDGEFHKRFQP